MFAGCDGGHKNYLIIIIISEVLILFYIKLILNVTLGLNANGIDVINFAILNNVDYIAVDERLMSK